MTSDIDSLPGSEIVGQGLADLRNEVDVAWFRGAGDHSQVGQIT